MRKKAIEIIIVILCLAAIVLAARYFAEQTIEDKRAMEKIVNRW